ncbi:hypothetical protein [Geodermatophilus sp. URMC 62]|uniref:hypothetical protein n=1 Tax=Geodermatophilus sp. URMC 62 TaxID=3423414 RepID=UPI00406C5182
MGLRGAAGGPGWAGPPARGALGRAVDRPLFWWSAGAIFLVNAALSAAEGRWLLALLQGLTCLWAAVAGVTAQVTPGSGEPTGVSREQAGGPDRAP